MKRYICVMVVSAICALGMNAMEKDAVDGNEADEPAKFKKIDTNGDGKLSSDEFKAAFSGENAEKKFATADTDKDGCLTPGELKAARRGARGENGHGGAKGENGHGGAKGENGHGGAKGENGHGGAKGENGQIRSLINGDGVLTKAEAEAMPEK